MQNPVLAGIVKDLNKKYKKDIVMLGNKLQPVERIPFGTPKMNWLTRGGMPRGRMVEFVGAEGSGKTTTALDVIAQTQKKGILCFFVDAENTLDEDWANKIGVDVENLLIIKPTQNESAEELLQIVLDLVATGQFGCGVVDSIPFLVPKAVIEGTMEDKSYCGNAGAMTTFVHKSIGLLAKKNCLLIMINQLRDKIGATYVSYNTPGGRALKHAYSFRLFFNKGRFVDKDCKEVNNSVENPAGNIVEVKVEKNKVCKPDRRLGSYLISYTKGVDVMNDTIMVACQVGILRQSGAWYNFIDPETGEILSDGGELLKFNGKAKLLEGMRSKPHVFEELYNKVNLLVSDPGDPVDAGEVDGEDEEDATEPAYDIE